MARICAQSIKRLELLNRRDRKTLPLSVTDESSEGLASDVGRCDVGWTRDNLKPADAKDLDLSFIYGPNQPAKE